ncbi:hypothetical protein HON22_00745 [Candidatus Peregrinibacteria bacterium]|jgi:PKD repeat protein|nr:hypothetical protein [Candidatus Peregrinibacteria bacterium]
MTKLFRSLLFSIALLGNASFAEGGEVNGLVKSKIIEATFDAKITVDDYVPIGKAVLFDASDSKIYNEEEFGPASYQWDFFDEKEVQIGKNQVYSYESPGKKRLQLTIKQGDREIMVEKEIFVYRKKALLITDSEHEAFLKDIDIHSAEAGTWLKTFSVGGEDTGFLEEEKLLQKITESTEFIKEADLLLFYTSSIDSFSAFTRFYKGLTYEKIFPLEKKIFVQVSDGNFNIQKNIIDRSRKILGVPSVLLTRKEAFNPLFESGDFSQILSVLDARAIESIMVDERVARTPAFFLSRIISFFVTSGVPSNTLYLLLVFPFLAFFVAFSRQFIGFSTFGVYLPIMLSLSFFVLGVSFAFMVIAFVAFISILIRLFLVKVEMLYIPKVALGLSTIALSFFMLIWLALYIDSSIVIPLAIFPMLVISTLSEKFISAQSQEGMWSAVVDMLETILVAFVGYFLADLTFFRDLLLSLPELIFIPLIATFLLGKFTGLRITEYFKFRSVFREGTEE